MGSSLIRLNLLKIFHGKRIKFTTLSLISPLAEMELGKNSGLSVGSMIGIRSGCKIRVREKGEIQIGNNTSLNHGCMIVSHERITLGENVQLGPNVLIYDHDHDFRLEGGLKKLKYKTSPVEIGNNVWIGANSIILRGTKVEANCVIGAGSVIKGHIPNDTVVVHKRENE